MATDFATSLYTELERTPETELTASVLERSTSEPGELYFLPGQKVFAYERVFTIENLSQPGGRKEEDSQEAKENRFPIAIHVIRETLPGEGSVTGEKYEPTKYGVTYEYTFRGDMLREVFPDLQEFRLKCHAVSLSPNRPFNSGYEKLMTFKYSINGDPDSKPALEFAKGKKLLDLVERIENDLYKKLLEKSSEGSSLRMYLQDLNEACLMILAIEGVFMDRRDRLGEEIPEEF